MALHQMRLPRTFSYKYNYTTVIIVFILIMFCSNTYANIKKLSYVFDFKSDGLHIKACLQNANKNLVWLLPKFIEINKKDHQVRIQTSQSEIVLSPKYDYIESLNKAGDNVCVLYTLGYGSGWYNGYFQDINKKKFLIFGDHSFVIPDFKDNDINVSNVTFIWKNFNQLIDSTFGSFQKNITVDIKQIGFSSFYFSSGYNVVVNGTGHNKLVFQSQHSSIIKTLNHKMVKIIQTVDNYFNISDSFYNTFVFVQNDRVYPGNPGYALSDNQNFLQVIGLNHKQIIDNNLLYTIAHEYFHKIIGYLIKIDPQNQNKDYWFLEGFTDYFSTKLNLDIGIWSLDDYLEFYNKRIYQYFSFGMQKHEIADLYGLYIYDNAGYIAGMMYAHKIESTLKENSYGKLNLLDFIKIFMNKLANNKQYYFSTHLFLNQLYKYSGIQFKDIETLRKSKGLLDKKILDNSLCLIKKSVKVPYYKVDLFKLVKELKITDKDIKSIKEDSKNEYVHQLEVIDNNQHIQSILLQPFFKLATIPQYIKCSK